jgi:hypothetical protein
MPAHITHALAGQRCVRSVHGLERLALSPAFLLGCQGPDVFSHNRRTKPSALAYARLLHRRDYGSFCAAFVRQLARSGRAASADWIYGFVTHQAVDRALHPYIVYRSWFAGDTGITGVTSARMHAFLERILDAELYRALEHKPVSAFDSDSLRVGNGSRRSSGREVDRVAGSLERDIALALSGTYPGESDGSADIEARVANAFIDSLRYYDITNPARISMNKPPDPERAGEFARFSYDGVALLHPESVDRDVDWLNAERSPWLDPVTGAERRESVEDLFAAAVKIGSCAILALRDALDGSLDAADFALVIGNGSLAATDFDGNVAPVRYSMPFDLARHLREEAERRFAWLSATAEIDPPRRG